MTDVIIIGGGIIGGSTLYHLGKLGYTGKVLILEREDALSKGSTALSAGGFRNIWTTPINMKLTSYSIQRLGAGAEGLAGGADVVDEEDRLRLAALRGSEGAADVGGALGLREGRLRAALEALGEEGGVAAQAQASREVAREELGLVVAAPPQLGAAHRHGHHGVESLVAVRHDEVA